MTETLHVMIPQLLGIKWMDPNWLLAHFGSEFFWVSVVIIFIECGLLFPFLPGDTLLFAIGLFISGGRISPLPGGTFVNLIGSMLILAVAALLGNISGYEIGRAVGPPLFARDGRLLKKKHLDRTSAFFDRHGSKALVIGRFVPFVRTFITLVAGVARMERHKFITWSAVGAAAWVLGVTLLGYFLGQAFPSLGKNIDKAILVILLFSVVPVVYEWWKHRRQLTSTE